MVEVCTRENVCTCACSLTECRVQNKLYPWAVVIDNPRESSPYTQKTHKRAVVSCWSFFFFFLFYLFRRDSLGKDRKTNTKDLKNKIAEEKNETKKDKVLVIRTNPIFKSLRCYSI